MRQALQALTNTGLAILLRVSCYAEPAGKLKASETKDAAVRHDELARLAHNYLYTGRDSDEPEKTVFVKIRALNASDARVFHQLLLDSNGYTGVGRKLFDAAFEYATAHGKSFLDLTPEDRAAIEDDLVRQLAEPSRGAP